MKRVLGVLRFAVAVVCVSGAVTGVVFAQAADDKTWEDAIALFDQAAQAQQEAQYADAIALYENALGIAPVSYTHLTLPTN